MSPHTQYYGKAEIRQMNEMKREKEMNVLYEKRLKRFRKWGLGEGRGRGMLC